MSFEVPLIFYHPERRLVTISAVVEGGSSGLAGVLGLLAVRNVKVLGLMSWVTPYPERSIGLNLVADVTDVKGDLSELVAEMGRVGEVAAMTVYESEVRGLATCVKGGFPTFLGERLFVMPQALFRGLYHTLYEALGGSAFAILRHAGRRVGGFARALGALVGEPVDLVRVMNEVSSVLGLAREIMVVSTEGGAMRVVARELADCVSVSDLRPGVRTGHFFAGVLEALFRGAEGEECEVEEVECVNAGGVACVFEVRRVKV
ncbi:MAG: hypothetical protein ABDH63_03360 [Candidatus Caldarchaeales archaeon]